MTNFDKINVNYKMVVMPLRDSLHMRDTPFWWPDLSCLLPKNYLPPLTGYK